MSHLLELFRSHVATTSATTATLTAATLAARSCRHRQTARHLGPRHLPPPPNCPPPLPPPFPPPLPPPFRRRCPTLASLPAAALAAVVTAAGTARTAAKAAGATRTAEAHLGPHFAVLRVKLLGQRLDRSFLLVRGLQLGLNAGVRCQAQQAVEAAAERRRTRLALDRHQARLDHLRALSPSRLLLRHGAQRERRQRQNAAVVMMVSLSRAITSSSGSTPVCFPRADALETPRAFLRY